MRKKKGFKKKSPGPMVIAAVLLLVGALAWMGGIVGREKAKNASEYSLEYEGNLASNPRFKEWKTEAVDGMGGRMDALTNALGFSGKPAHPFAARVRDAAPWFPEPAVERGGRGWSLENKWIDDRSVNLVTLHPEGLLARSGRDGWLLDAAALDGILFGLSPKIYKTIPRWFLDGCLLYYSGDGEAWLKADIARRAMRGTGADPIRPLDDAFHSMEDWGADYLIVRSLSDRYGPNAPASILQQLYQGKSLQTILEQKTGMKWDAFLKEAAQWAGQAWKEEERSGPKIQWLAALSDAAPKAERLAAAEKILQFPKNHPAKSRAQVWIARNLTESGRPPDVLSNAWAKALAFPERMPEDPPVIRLALADIKMAAGKKEEAAALYELALSGCETFEWAPVAGKLADALWQTNRIEEASKLKKLTRTPALD